MSWKVRHEGSPRAVEGLTPEQVLEGLRDGHWAPTDEVIGPQDAGWVRLEDHPQFAEAAEELEPEPASAHVDEVEESARSGFLNALTRQQAKAAIVSP